MVVRLSAGQTAESPKQHLSESGQRHRKTMSVFEKCTKVDIDVHFKCEVSVINENLNQEYHSYKTCEKF